MLHSSLVLVENVAPSWDDISVRLLYASPAGNFSFVLILAAAIRLVLTYVIYSHTLSCARLRLSKGLCWPLVSGTIDYRSSLPSSELLFAVTASSRLLPCIDQ